MDSVRFAIRAWLRSAAVMNLLARPLVLAAALVAMPARAQWLGADYATFGAPQVNYAASSFLNFTYLNEATPRRAGAAASTVVTSSGDGAASAAALAKGYPAEHRARMAGIFKESLAAFRKLEVQLNVPRNDLAVAMAAFICGHYMALHDQPLPPDAQFIALANQLRGGLVRSSALAGASKAVRQEAYEQFAMMGMFMATAQLALVQQRPGPQAEANFRQHARANLGAVLKVPAERLELTAGGLRLR